MRTLALVAVAIALAVVAALALLPEDPVTDSSWVPETHSEAGSVEAGDRATPVLDAEPAKDTAHTASSGSANALPTQASVRERQDAPEVAPGPPRLVGRVTGLDEDGTPLGPLTGDLLLSFVDGPDRLPFVEGHFEVPAGAYPLDSGLEVWRVKSADGRPLHLPEGRMYLRLDTDKVAHVELRRRPDVLLDVVSAASGARLSPVLFLADWRTMPGSLDTPTSIGETRSWSTEPPVDLASLPPELHETNRLLITAPGHAWQELLVDLTQSGRPVIALEPGADVTIVVPEALLPDDGTSPLDPEALEALEGLAGSSDDKPRANVMLTLLDGEQAGRKLAEIVDVRHHRAWELIGLPVGSYRILATDVRDGRLLAATEVALDAGPNPKITLEGAVDPGDLLATLEIELGEPWEPGQLTLVDGQGHERTDALDWSPLAGGGQLARATGLSPGLWSVSLESPRAWEQLTLEQGAVERIAFGLAELVEVTVEVVDAATGQAVRTPGLTWVASLGDDLRTGAVHGLAEPLEGTGRFRIEAPLGRVRLAIDSGIPGALPSSTFGLLEPFVELAAAGQHLTLKTDRVHDFTLVFTDGDRAVAHEDLQEVWPALTFDGPGSPLYLIPEGATLSGKLVGTGTWRILMAETASYRAANSDPFGLTGEGKPRVVIALERKEG